MNSILLIDDQPITNFITKKLLSLKGIEIPIIDFTNPLEALENVKNSKESFIFLDLNMPEMTGWEFLDEVKKLNLNHKIVILTSSTSDLDLEKARDYPCVVEYVIKPLSIDKLNALNSFF
ncbi:response regulator [Gillisia sp. M10.2A]|uniref:Response regulator n=1 Tax=Gillisia lutea TaxID=2909668 RepID=A0ABS9EHP9_9FLAO|nr:response regulator [Gillisia lutea]MCF4101280.1 response regulator [Gillisia lutea]